MAAAKKNEKTLKFLLKKNCYFLSLELARSVVKICFERKLTTMNMFCFFFLQKNLFQNVIATDENRSIQVASCKWFACISIQKLNQHREHPFDVYTFAFVIVADFGDSERANVDSAAMIPGSPLLRYAP